MIGEFNDWQEEEMNKIYDGNFWECHIPEAKPGQMYKYRIYDRSGNPVDHCDPYGFGMELRPNSASIIRDMNRYKFHPYGTHSSNSWHRTEGSFLSHRGSA